MSILLDLMAGLLLLAGAGFTLVAGIGVLRMEDVYVRMHASTKAGTLGLLLVVAALALNTDRAAMVEKGVALFLLVIATAPVAAHLVGRAVWRVMEQADGESAPSSPSAGESEATDRPPAPAE